MVLQLRAMAPYLKSGFKMRVQRTVVAELEIVVTQKSSKSINRQSLKMQIQIQVALLSLSTVEHQKCPALAVRRGVVVELEQNTSRQTQMQTKIRVLLSMSTVELGI